MPGISREICSGLAGISLLLLAGPAMAQPAPVPPKPIPPTQRLAASEQIAISNGVLNAVILPPGERAFYRGTRFDQSGVIGSLKFGAQEYYGPWFDAIQPLVRDLTFGPEGVLVGDNSGTMGPAEEYDPIGYDDAAPGGRFVHVGAGVLVRPDEKPFDRWHRYRIADAGAWRTTHTAGSVTTTHTVSHDGYAYVYEKTITLLPGQPRMTIAHRLRNTGSKPIATSMYNHNFLTLNPGQADMVLTLPFPATAQKTPARLALSGNTVRWPAPLVDPQSGFVQLYDESRPPQPYDVRVQNEKTGAGFHVTGDLPITRMVLWSIRTVMSVEPYNRISVAPGAEQRWTYTYTFLPPKP